MQRTEVLASENFRTRRGCIHAIFAVKAKLTRKYTNGPRLSKNFQRRRRVRHGNKGAQMKIIRSRR